MSDCKNTRKKLYATVILWLVFIPITALATPPTFKFYALDARPVGYKEGEQVKGYYADILRRVSEELNIENPRLVTAPFSRIFHSLNDNSSGYVLTCLFNNEDFADHVYQPQAIAHFKTGVISIPSAPFTWENSLGKRVATIRGASKSYGKKFHYKVANGDLDLVPVTNYTHAVRMLKNSRIDGFAGNLAVILYQTKTVDVEFARPEVITQKTSSITISVAPGTPDGEETVKKIATIVAKMQSSGEIKRIIDSYLPKSAQAWYKIAP